MRSGGPFGAPSLISPFPGGTVLWYNAYGRLLASELPFPELREAAPGEAFWTFRCRSDAPPALPDAPMLGAQAIYGACRARLFGTSGSWRIMVDDTGVYDLCDGGRTITWHPAPGSSTDFGRAHFLGRVLSTCMHFNGALVLHGSAVSYPGGAAVFLAPKHTGKSTLALALTRAGARLITDDTITVALPDRGRPEVRPGVHSLRLFPDAASRLAGGAPSDRREDGKILVAHLPPDRLEDRVVPLAAVYLLAAAESIVGGEAAARRPLPPPLAAAAMVGQGKISEMLGAAEAPVLLRRAAVVASRIPVYQLAVHRDLDRLAEVAAQLAGWHAQAPGGAV